MPTWISDILYLCMMQLTKLFVFLVNTMELLSLKTDFLPDVTWTQIVPVLLHLDANLK